MDGDRLLALLVAFLHSWQLRVALGAIVLDVGLGVAAALKTGVFSWLALGKCYKSQLAPYALGYCVAYVASYLIVPGDWLGGIAPGAIATALWAPVGVRLAARITANVQILLGVDPERTVTANGAKLE